MNQNDTSWNRMPRHIRKSLVWSLWFVTWVGLLTGLFDSTFYEYVTLFCIAHTMFVLYLVGFRVAAFPAQVRIAFTIGVAVGSYVPYLESLLYLKMAGLVANLILGYCPMAHGLSSAVESRRVTFHGLGPARDLLCARGREIHAAIAKHRTMQSGAFRKSLIWAAY
ncbi:hypothetical protein KFU94_01360 [Chloroflexi bacterium TSY]|nr:hypothetical protein [Chloroflexi bacterium TSY]